jgi:hypothetical protein
MNDLNHLTLRELQLESARALEVLKATNNNLSVFNKQANHDSQHWYKLVIESYIAQWGDLPSLAGPGANVKLLNSIKTATSCTN